MTLTIHSPLREVCLSALPAGEMLSGDVRLFVIVAKHALKIAQNKIATATKVPYGYEALEHENKRTTFLLKNS